MPLESIRVQLNTLIEPVKVSDTIDATHVAWYSTSGMNGVNVIGIVRIHDKVTDEEKTYLGIGVGGNESDDIREIASWGTQVIPV